MEQTNTKTRAHWAKQAIAVQDACNLSGVLHSFLECVRWVRENEELGTEGVNHHPLVVLFASKVNSLAGYEQLFSAAYTQAQEWAKEEE